jgi:PAS domain S-box-containing protein
VVVSWFTEVMHRSRDRAEQRRESLRVTLASIGDAVITTDTAGRVTFLNPVAESLTGWGQEQAQGQPLDVVFPVRPEQTRTPVEDPVETVVRDGVIAGPGNPTVLLAADGTKRPIDHRAAPIRGETGETVGVVLIFRDVTEQRRAEQALRDSEQRFTRFMDHLPGLAWIKDLHGRYEYANDAAMIAFNIPRAELYGKTDEDVFPPETAALFRENDRRALDSGTGVQVIETLEQGDGVRHHSLVSKFPIAGPDGRAALVGGMAIDITDRLRAEEALKDADRRKDEFLAVLAHELRNPLAPIRNSLHIMKQVGTDAALLGRVREMVERQVQHMTRMVDDLLDVSRITRGKIELRKEAVDLGPVVERTAEAARPLFEDRRQTLTVDLPPEPLRLEADPTRLEQVLANLLNNAAKYTDHGGQVFLSVRREGGGLVLRVRDTGVGIAPDMLAHVFEPFVQADRVLHQSQGGLGIGLTLVRRLVEMHGGSVTAHSEGPAKGSEFVVRLPAVAAESPTPGATAAGAGGEPARAATRRRIVVADDNVDAAESLALLLRLDGHDVRVAHDGAAALAAVEADPPDLVILDIGMPVMNGYDVARRLRQRPGLDRLMLVAMTGWGQAEDRRRSHEAGFDHHLIKPVEPEALRRLLAGMSARPA